MSENKKTISIDKDLFTLSSKKGGKKNKTEKKEKKKSVVKPNKLRKDLLSKIKKHQQMEQMKLNNKEENQDIKKEFNESLEYLHNLSKKNKQNKQNKQKTRKNFNNTKNIGENLVNIDLPENIFNNITPDKDDSKKSYITNNTSFNNTLPSSLQTENLNNTPPVLSVTTQSLIKDKINNPNQEIEINKNVTPLVPVAKNEGNSTILFDDKIQLESRPNLLNEINIPSDNSIPYGCLKGGDKPTFRNWNNKTLKNNNSIKPQIDLNKHKKFKRKKKNTRKTTYKLGKTKENICFD